MIITCDGEEFETEEVFLPGEPFKAESSGMLCWLIQDGNVIRRCDNADVIDAVYALNDMFQLDCTPDAFEIAWDNNHGTVHTSMGFTTSYATTGEALDFLMEGLRQDDYYEMLERIENK